MESPTERLLSHIFTISLEGNRLPKVRSCLCNYRWYVNEIP